MAVLISPDVTREKIAPNQLLLLGRSDHEQLPQASQTGRLLGSVARGIILLTFAAGALTLLSVGLMPAVFVALLLFLPALVPIILLGFAFVLSEDVQRDAEAKAGQPCSCHHDRLENR